MCKTSEKTWVHPFEKAGFGVAPYRCVEVAEKTYQVAAGSLTPGPVLPAGTCDYCGTGIRWCYTVRSFDGVEFVVGSDCVAKVDATLAGQVNRMGRVAKRQAKYNARRAAAKAQGEAVLSSNEDLAKALETDHHISKDLKAKLLQYGSLSDKQIALAFKLQKQVAEQAANREAEAELLANAPDWSEGRIEVEGKVLCTKVVDSNFGTQTKMLVQLADGRKCWGTVPQSLFGEEIHDAEGNYVGWAAREVKGSTVKFTATFTPKDGDAKFAWFKRPASATVTKEAEGAEAPSL